MTDLEMIAEIVRVGGMGRTQAAARFGIKKARARDLCTMAKGIMISHANPDQVGHDFAETIATSKHEAEIEADYVDRAGTQYEVKPETNSYTFSWPKGRKTRPTTITSVKLHAMLLQYSHHGFGDTAAQVAAVNGMQKWQVRAMFNALGVVKEGVPCTPEAVAEAVENGLLQELEDRLAAFATAKLEKKLRDRQIRKIEADAAKWKDSGDAFAKIMEDVVKRTAIAIPKRSSPTTPDGEGNLAIFVNDWHFGAYASARINGTADYSRQIAKDVLRSSIRHLVHIFPGVPKSILLALNGDLCHIDNMAGNTTRGTPQDIDGVPAEIFDEYIEFMMHFPAEMLEYTDSVKVAVLPGNHDELITTAANAVIRCTYEDSEYIDVHQGSLSQTQHLPFGGAHIALHHGHSRQSSPKAAAAVMAQDALWGTTPEHFYVKGHTHHQTACEEHGIIHVTSTALVPSDVYHDTHWNGRFNPRTTGLWLSDTGALNGILHGRPDMSLYGV